MKLLLAASLLSLIAAQPALAQADPQLPPPPGVLVDVGVHDLHLYCQGEGSPTVIMDAGLGDWSLMFRDLQARSSEFTRVCSFDRAGYGWSETGTRPRTSQQNADELLALIEAAALEGPFVLVGHSYGGLNSILFANQHPDLVAGVVLIDSSHPEQSERMEAVPELVAMERSGMEQFRGLAAAAEQGQLLASEMLAMAPAGIPAGLRETWAQLFVQPENLQAGLAEYDALEESLMQVRENGSLGDIPLVVFARGIRLSDAMPVQARAQAGLEVETLERYDAIWRGLQEDHLTRSSDSRLIIAHESEHYIHFSEPELVVSAIRELVERY